MHGLDAPASPHSSVWLSAARCSSPCTAASTSAWLPRRCSGPTRLARDLGRDDCAHHVPASPALLLGRTGGRTAGQGGSVPPDPGCLRPQRLPAGKGWRSRQGLLRGNAQHHTGRCGPRDGGLRATVRPLRAHRVVSRRMADGQAAGCRHPRHVLARPRKHRRRLLRPDLL